MEDQNEHYSPIRHLASILWPPWLNREEAIFAMLTFAFDAGGDENTDYLTVAGFASSAKDWDSFSLKWKDRLDKDGIAFFRAVDANNFRGPFQHWYDLPNRNQLRQSLFSDLMELIKSHAYAKFGCTVKNKDFHESNSEMRELFVESAYSLAARTCEKYARHWVWKDWRSCPEMQIAMVFEAGDPGQSRLQERLRKDLGQLPANFRPKKDTPRDDGFIEYGFIPLQAGDWLAWELNRATRDADKGVVESTDQLRWPMQQFLGHPMVGRLGAYTPENLQEMDKNIDLEIKIHNWEHSVGINKKGTPA